MLLGGFPAGWLRAGDLRLPTIVPLPSDTPSITLTPSAIPLPTNTLAPTPTLAPTLTPTPAPVTYTVTDQDDMFGVSLRFGVSLDALKAANPGRDTQPDERRDHSHHPDHTHASPHELQPIRSHYHPGFIQPSAVGIGAGLLSGSAWRSLLFRAN